MILQIDNWSNTSYPVYNRKWLIVHCLSDNFILSRNNANPFSFKSKQPTIVTLITLAERKQKLLSLREDQINSHVYHICNKLILTHDVHRSLYVSAGRNELNVILCTQN